MLNAVVLRRRVAELLLERAAMRSCPMSDLIFRVAVNIEDGNPVMVEGFVSDAVARAAQDIAGMGHYEEAASIIEAQS